MTSEVLEILDLGYTYPDGHPVLSGLNLTVRRASGWRCSARTYGRQDLKAVGGYRTLMSAPLLLDDEVVGVISLWRYDVDPFDERAISLLQAFAAQAAVVVRNVHLVRALESRSAELARRVDQLEALSEVGATVSSSLVVDEVLSAIIANAVRFSGCDGGSIMEYVADQRSFSVRAAYATSPRLLARLRRARIELDGTLVGRAARESRPIAVPNLLAVPMDPHLQLLVDDGWRSILAVPMLRGGRVLGALVVRRKTTGSFSDEVIDFLVTFASQSAWPFRTPRSSANSRRSEPNSKSRVSTSPSSWRACPTSFEHPSMP